MSKFKMLLICTGLLLAFNHIAYAECFGSGEYQVCSESYTDSSGDVHVRSWDNQGNSYGVNSESYTSPSGNTTVRSYDTEGNSYSVRSWSDSTGVHSEDSEGNRCTITTSGTMIGCQ